MSKNWKEISKTIDPLSLSLYRVFATEAGAHPWLLVGGTARDLYCQRYGIVLSRATMDIDLAIQLGSWEQFEQIKNRLLALKEFKEGSQVMRLTFNGLPFDIIPFGGLAQKSQIKWPPDGRFEMNVMGFEDAIEAAEVVDFEQEEGPLEVRIATPPSLVMLKVFSWADKPYERAKDVQDIALIMSNYMEFGNWERLEEGGADSNLLDWDDFTTNNAAARLLGRDIASICRPATKKALVAILSKELEDWEGSQFACIFLPTLDPGMVAEARAIVQSLLTGIQD